MSHAPDIATSEPESIEFGQAAEAVVESAFCDICGFEILSVHCKIRCMNCGFVRDCSDP